MLLFEIKNLTKEFKTGKKKTTVLKNISFNLPSNGLISIVGKSGCGKSTLLNLLMGIERKTSGSILFRGKDISRMSNRRFSKYRLTDISMIYQHYNLLSNLNVEQNIVLPLKMQGKSKNKRRKTLENLMNSLNISKLMKRNVNELSGGEKQRVAICRALITNPSVLLCDEPTGALDHKNSKLIMEELKKISKERLVILVSHNKEIVKNYSDRIIVLKDGEIKSDTGCEIDELIISKKKNIRYHNSWVDYFSLKLFIKNKRKNIISIISCAFGFASIFLCIGFKEGSKQSQNNVLNENLSLGTATISKTSYYELKNSPLKLKKNVRPDVLLIDEFLGDYNTVQIEPNISYFFTPYPTGEIAEKKFESFEMIPVLDDFFTENSKKLKIAGDISDFCNENVIVNQEFLDLINIKENDALNQEFFIQYSTSITLNTQDPEKPFIKDIFSYHKKLKICGIIKEFSFMNSPKVYYDFLSIKNELKQTKLENISEYKHKNISCIDYLNECDDDEPTTSYSYSLFLKSLYEKERYFSLIDELAQKECELQIESQAYEISKTYNQFISSFSDALIIFVVISFVGVNFILGMISLSNFLERKKDSAILSCLGSRNSSIKQLFINQNFIIILISYMISIGLAILLTQIINPIFSSKFGLMNIIDIPFASFLGVPYLLIFGLFAVAFICSLLFTLIPICIYKKTSLSNELRDE